MARNNSASFDIDARDRTAAAFDSANRRLDKLKVGAAAAGLAISASLGVLSRQARQAIGTADALGKLSRVVGLTAEELQAYQYAADRAGVEQATFNQSMIAFVKRMGEARAGVGPLVSGLKGLDQELLVSLLRTDNQAEALRLVIDAIDKQESALGKARIANAAFSRSGVVMANIAADGAKGFEAEAQSAQRLGFVLNNTLVAESEAANDNLTVLSRTVETNMTRAILALAPYINSLSEGFVRLAENTRDWLDMLQAVENKSTKGMRLRLGELAEESAAAREKLATESSKLTRLVADNAIGDHITRQENIVSRLRARVESLRAEYERVSGLIENRQTPVKPMAVSPISADILEKIGGGDKNTFVKQAGEWVADALRARQKAFKDAFSEVEDTVADAFQAYREEQRAIQDSTTALQRRADQSRAMIEATRQGEAAVAALAAAHQIENDAVAQGIDLTTTEGAAWRQAAEEAQFYESRLDAVTRAQEAAKRAGEEVGRTISGAMKDIIFNANSASEAVRNLGLRLAEMIFDKTVGAAFESAFGSLFTGAFSGGGAVASGISTPVATIHGGGIVGQTTRRSMVNPAVFAHARRYHSGGVVGGVSGNDVPALLERGEEVLTESSPRHRRNFRGGGDTYIIDARGAAPGVEQQIAAVLERMRPGIVADSVRATANARRRDPYAFA